MTIMNDNFELALHFDLRSRINIIGIQEEYCFCASFGLLAFVYTFENDKREK